MIKIKIKTEKFPRQAFPVAGTPPPVGTAGPMFGRWPFERHNTQALAM